MQPLDRNNFADSRPDNDETLRERDLAGLSTASEIEPPRAMHEGLSRGHAAGRRRHRGGRRAGSADKPGQHSPTGRQVDVGPNATPRGRRCEAMRCDARPAGPPSHATPRHAQTATGSDLNNHASCRQWDFPPGQRSRPNADSSSVPRSWSASAPSGTQQAGCRRVPRQAGSRRRQRRQPVSPQNGPPSRRTYRRNGPIPNKMLYSECGK